MRKLKWILITYALFDFLVGGYCGGFLPLSPAAAAQFTQVTGTVLDPNNVAYAFGTIVPKLVISGTPTFVGGLAYTPPTQPVGLDINGKFLMQLADNTQLSPGGSQWSFLICSAAGTVQPAGGKGPVCFTVPALTISGASQNITTQINAAPPLALSNTSGGVAAASTFSLSNGATATAGGGIVNSLAYGTVSDSLVTNASVTNGQNIVTCPSSNCHFLTTAAVNNVAQGGTNAAGTNIAFTTILSVDSDTQIHTTANATASAAGTMAFAWGPDNTIPLQNAWLASGQICKFLYIPPGAYFTQQAFGNSQTAGCTNSTGGEVGGIIGGFDWYAVVIIMTSNFQYATGGTSGSGCNGGQAGGTCFGGVQFEDIDYLIFAQLYNNTCPAAFHTLVENNGGYLYRVGAGWTANCSNTAALALTGGEPDAREGYAIGGFYACISSGTLAELSLNPCEGGQYGLDVTAGQAFSHASIYSGTTAGVFCGSGADCHNLHDNIQGPIINAGTHVIEHSYLNAALAITNNSPGTLIFRDTNLLTATITNASGAMVVDGCGNNFVNLGTVTNSGVWTGQCSTNRVVVTAGRLILSAGWGTTAAWTGLSGFNNFVGTLTASGTGQAANPTITYNFPTAFGTPPQACDGVIENSSDTAGVTIAKAQLTSSGLTKGTVVWTYNGTPAAGATYVIRGTCLQ